MKVVILAGGLGWRLSEDNELRPKPMTEIGNRPLLWHQMHYFAHFGYKEFVIALGYKGEIIKKYIVDYLTIGGDLMLDGRRGTVQQVAAAGATWRVEMVDTGLKTQTGGRLKRLAPQLGDSTFFVTWGDILHDVDLNAFLAQHRRLGRLATVAAVRPPMRFERLEIDDELVVNFGLGLDPDEALFGALVGGDFGPRVNRGWISGALFILEPGALDYINDNRTQFDQQPLRDLSRDLQLAAYRHPGFWQCVDAMRDKRHLDREWDEGRARWRVSE